MIKIVKIKIECVERPWKTELFEMMVTDEAGGGLVYLPRSDGCDANYRICDPCNACNKKYVTLCADFTEGRKEFLPHQVY